MPELKAPTIDIKRYDVEMPDSQVPLYVFGVEVTMGYTIVAVAFGSEAEVHSFLRGIGIACVMCGSDFPRAEIPEESSGKLERKLPPPQEGDSSIPF